MTVRPRGARAALGAVTAALFLLLAAGCAATPEEWAADLGPPEGQPTRDETVTMARADWDTGWMQAAIYQQLLEELGYEVADPSEETYAPETFYPLLARRDVDLWANGWFPLHTPFLERELVTGYRLDLPVEPVGTQVAAGALQGYLVDMATAERLAITSMGDFTRPEVAQAFDHDGDGRADLYGCNEGWGCNLTIAEHIDAHDWGASVEQVVGDYDELIAEVRERIDAGEPALFYTWTPNWTIEVLEPGTDVVWLESAPLPGQEAATSVSGLEGCAGEDPCELGWEVNDIRAVANSDFLDEHPTIRRLLEAVEIPQGDIAEQNSRMAGAERYTEEQIDDDAAAWIAENRSLVDQWLSAARQE